MEPIEKAARRPPGTWGGGYSRGVGGRNGGGPPGCGRIVLVGSGSARFSIFCFNSTLPEPKS